MKLAGDLPFDKNLLLNSYEISHEISHEIWKKHRRTRPKRCCVVVAGCGTPWGRRAQHSLGLVNGDIYYMYMYYIDYDMQLLSGASSYSEYTCIYIYIHIQIHMEYIMTS